MLLTINTINQLFGPNYSASASASASVNTTIRPNIRYSVNNCFGRSLLDVLQCKQICSNGESNIFLNFHKLHSSARQLALMSDIIYFFKKTN